MRLPEETELKLEEERRLMELELRLQEGVRNASLSVGNRRERRKLEALARRK